MHEEFLYYLWKNRLFHSNEFKSATGELIEIINPGQRNDDSGPDFFNARVKVDGFIWAGNVEIHVKSSDWLRHGHGYDKAFDTVILHVVYDADIAIKRFDGSIIPTIELRGKYDNNKWQHYLDLIQGTSNWIPCEKNLNEVPEIIKHQWFDRVLVERLEERSKSINKLFTLTNNNWEESFYRHLSKSFGFRVNTLPFEILTSIIPLPLIGKHKNQLEQIEAMLFGCAGFLEKNNQDYYTKALTKEYNFLKVKFGLDAMSVHLWKFGRLRPGNFPTIRIAQLASLLYENEQLFDKVIHANSFKDLIELLNIKASSYWNRHYSFEAKSEFSEKNLGRSSIESLIINTIAPFTFFYGQYHQQDHLIQKSLSWLEKCKPENNLIIRGWEQTGIKIKDAANSQALIHQKKMYCDFKKCVNCGIGNYLLQQT